MFYLIESIISFLIIFLIYIYLSKLHIIKNNDNYSIRIYIYFLCVWCLLISYLCIKDIDIFFYIHNLFIINESNEIIKIFILIQFSILCFFWPLHNNFNNTIKLFVLLLFCILGLNIAVSSRDLMLLYMGLEMSSIPLYILVSNKNYMVSIEAGIKYYILSAISSTFFLLSIGFIYGLTGSTLYSNIYIYELYALNIDIYVLYLIYILLIIIFLFKIGIYPFNLWITNFYEGAALNIVFFLSLIPKLPYLYILIILNFNIFPKLIYIKLILIIFALLTIVSTLIEGLTDNHIGRIIGQSSMINMSIIFIAVLSLVLIQEVFVSFLFLFYMIPTLLLFSLLSLREINENKRNLIVLHDLYLTNNYLLILLYFTLISLAGLPFLAGFIGKWYIFKLLIDYNSIKIVLILLITSVIASIFYTRIFFYLINRIRFNNYKIKQASFIKYFIITAIAFLNFSLIFLQEILLGSLLSIW